MIAKDDSPSDESSSCSDLDLLCHIITPIGMLGYGYNESQTRVALQELSSSPAPVAIIADSGSTDGGPAKLATGKTSCPRSAYIRDLGRLLVLAHEFNVPVLTSSCGGDGTNDHVDDYVKIIEENVAVHQNLEDYSFKTLVIYSNIDKGIVHTYLQNKSVTPCGTCVPELTPEDVDSASHIVAQMGPEPLLDAMYASPDFDVLIAGRSYDPCPYIAWCIFCATKKGIDALSPTQLGGFTMMGKIMECGALCATPKSQSAVAHIYRDGTFEVKPLLPGARCTPASVAAHTLYEKSRPDLLPGPGGILDTTGAKYEQLEDNTSVRVRGALFRSSRSEGLPYTIKLEGAKLTGYRTFFMGGIRDPILIFQIDTVLENIKKYVASQHETAIGDYELAFHVYGVHGVMGTLEPGDASYQPREVFIVGESQATTQELATSVAYLARIGVIHSAYPGQKATAGNFAWGIAGTTEVETGRGSEFCVYHLLPLEPGQEGAYELGVARDDAASKKPIFSWRKIACGAARSHATTRSARKYEGSFKPLLALQPSPLPLAANGSVDLSISHPPRTLADIARVVRSKNSGPYEITMDVIFDSPAIYQIVKAASASLEGLLSPVTICKLYNLEPRELIHCGFYDPAMAFKATVPRKLDGVMKGAGGFMEGDIHGAQQSVGLLELKLGEEVVGKVLEVMAGRAGKERL